MTNPLVWHEHEIAYALKGTRLRQTIVLFVTLGGLFTVDGGVPAAHVQASLGLNDEAWAREYKRLHEETTIFEVSPGRVGTTLTMTLARYAPAGIAGRPTQGIWRALREQMAEEIFGDTKGYCLACHAEDVPLALDHSTPIIRGGSNHPLNLMWLCVRCNSSKGTKTWEEWRMEGGES